ncbi:hypothetical protein EV294_106288 [Paenibacillus sp. BK033]|uniref:hypothetical protein n=1 Tax=Paenibacillus sp. BK033 TaxID=2512133 RepID=UPI00104D5499|nr:hypothetical protein [Paenibacillus sp. BK033]TCM95917.1 hypothetical protein EV294_106288 [Paenibacillus sp. BK033]
MDWIKRIIGLLPSASILFSAALCVIIPMCFYEVSRRMRRHDPPWKQEMPEGELEKTMLPASSSNDQYEE